MNRFSLELEYRTFGYQHFVGVRIYAPLFGRYIAKAYVPSDDPWHTIVKSRKFWRYSRAEEWAVTEFTERYSSYRYGNPLDS